MTSWMGTQGGDNTISKTLPLTWVGSLTTCVRFKSNTRLQNSSELSEAPTSVSQHISGKLKSPKTIGLGELLMKEEMNCLKLL